MNQSNFNQQNNHFNYDHYQQPPQEPGFVERVFGPSIATKLRSPVIATGALLLAGVVFAGVIMVSYPSGDDPASVPVVQAELAPFKERPSDIGGMDIPHQDSTVFSGLRDPAQDGGAVENLLAQEDSNAVREDSAERLEAFAAEAERIIEESQDAAAQSGNLRESAETVDLIEEVTGVKTAETKPIKQEVEKINAADLMQKVETAAVASTTSVETPAVKPGEKPASFYKPGASPETLEFVKNVLEKKDSKVAGSATATQAAAIKPAAGLGAAASVPGTHYIQLGSVKSEAGAAGEWGKLQKKFPSVAGMDYRVQRADLGERGVFYRIQAGPISGESAKSICGGIKAQNPGACLVTR